MIEKKVGGHRTATAEAQGLFVQEGKWGALGSQLFFFAIIQFYSINRTRGPSDDVLAYDSIPYLSL